jgi:hypothetical protein
VYSSTAARLDLGILLAVGIQPLYSLFTSTIELHCGGTTLAEPPCGGTPR